MTADNIEVDLKAADTFLKLLDPNDRYSFQTFEDKKLPMRPALAKIIHSPNAAPKLKDLHQRGAGIYITVNETNLQGRSIEHITRIRAVFQEDDDGFEGEFPLEPTCIVQTSPGHFHRHWFVEGDWLADEQGRADFANVMERMIASYGSDKNAKDITRVLRVPGFLHRKNGEAHPVKMIACSGRRYTREQILQAFPPVTKQHTPALAPSWRPPRSDDEIARIEDALHHINADARDVWLQVGMALKDEMGDAGRTLWDNWSAHSEKFKERDQEKIWRSFRRNGIGIGTLFFHAKQGGWSAQSNIIASLKSEPRSTPSAENKNPEPDSRLSKFTMEGSKPPAPQPMLIDGIMIENGLPFIGGQSSAGKTFIAVLLATCLATGKPFMGHKVNKRVGTVIVAAEGREMLAARISAAKKELGVVEPIAVAWINQVSDFSQGAAVAEFVKDLKAIDRDFQRRFGIPLGLVLVDTVSASFDIKEEADNSEAARVCKIMRHIGGEAHALVCPIHHFGKNAGVGLRGASAWRANADFVLSVMADIDPQNGNVTNRQLAIAKDRDGAQGPLTPFELKRVDLGIDEDGKAWGSLVAVAGERGQPTTQWSEHLRIIRQALSTALINHGKKERPLLDGPEVIAVAEYAVREEFDRIAHVDSPPEKQQEALRKQFSRKLNAAQSKGLIALHRDKSGHAIIWFVSGKETAGADPDTKSTP